MQAITTRFLGPTNHHGSRIKATCDAGSITLPWDHSLNSEGNHDAAAKALIRKLGWLDTREGWVRGWAGGGYVYCAFSCPVDRFRVDSE